MKPDDDGEPESHSDAIPAISIGDLVPLVCMSCRARILRAKDWSVHQFDDSVICFDCFVEAKTRRSAADFGRVFMGIKGLRFAAWVPSESMYFVETWTGAQTSICRVAFDAEYLW